MKKKSFLTIFVSAILAFCLVACDSSTPATATTPTPEPQVTEATPTTAEVTPVKDPANDPVNDGNADVAGGDGVGETPTEPTEDPTEAPTEPTEVPIEPTETPTPEVPDEPEPSEIDKYIKDGVFDVELFANDTGASEWHGGDNSFIMIYNGTVYVQSDNEINLPGTSSIVIGIWDTSRADYWNVRTHSFLLDTGDTINTSIGVAMSKTALGFLPETVRFVKANGVDTVPDVDGANFRPCDPRDSTIQY